VLVWRETGNAGAFLLSPWTGLSSSSRPSRSCGHSRAWQS